MKEVNIITVIFRAIAITIIIASMWAILHV